MAGVIKNQLGDIALASWEAVSIMIDNLITGIAEAQALKDNETIRKNLREIATRHLPFFDKIDEMKKAVSEIGGPKDHELREQLNQQLDEIAKQGLEVKEGMEEVRKAFENSGLSSKDKKRIFKEIERCENTMTNLYSIKIPAYNYKKFMALARRADAHHDITVMEQANGQYIVFYPAQHSKTMEYALELATLSEQQHPSVSAVARSAYFGAQDKGKAGVLKFEGLEATLAEKVVQEANHYSYVNFAKELIPETNPPKYTLVCEAGETDEERNRNYREAIEIIAKSALAVSGPLKDAEAKKMQFEANRFEKLADGLESGSGYVYSVMETARGEVQDPRNFIRFETDKVNGNGQFFVNHNGVIATTVYESETDRYKDQLYHMAQGGSGKKVFISDHEMQEMKNTALRIYDRLQKEGATMSAEDFSRIAIEKGNESKELKDRKQYTLSRAAKQESIEASAVVKALLLTKKYTLEEKDGPLVIADIVDVRPDALTKKEILDGIISEHLYQNTYQMRVNSELAQGGKAIQRMAKWCAKETRKEAALSTENRLRMESSQIAQDFSIPGTKILQELDRFNPDAFLDHEFHIAVPDTPENQDSNELTVSKVQKEHEVLEQYYPETLQEAKKLLEDVRVHMVEAEVSLDAKDISAPFARSNAKREREIMAELEQDLTPDRPFEMPEYEEHEKEPIERREFTH